MESLARKVFSLRGISSAYIALLLLWFTTWRIFGEPVLLMIVLNRAAVWLFVPAAPLLGFAVFKRRWGLVTMQAVPLILFLSLFSPYLIPRSGSSAGSDPSSRLRVMTFNLRLGNDRYDDIASRIRALDPDIVCLQEVTPQGENSLSRLLTTVYPWHHAGGQSESGSCAIFSKIRPEQFDEVRLGTGSPAVMMTIGANDESLTVVSARLSPYRFRGKSIATYGQSISEQTDAQHREARRLAYEVMKRNDRTILGIDANTKETCLTYRLLARNLTNAARKIGWRIGAKPPAGTTIDTRIGRLDYLFYSGAGIVPDSVSRARDSAGSNHQPVVGDFYLTGVDVAGLKLANADSTLVTKDGWGLNGQ